MASRIHREWPRISLLLGILVLVSACGSNATHDPAADAQLQEKQRLESENQELASARAAHEEVRQLTKENQDLPRLRSQYQEAARLRKENEQMRQQIAKLPPPRDGSRPADGADPAAAIELAQQDNSRNIDPANDSTLINEGDDILVDPKLLHQILPDVEWDKLQRKDPVPVKTFLERSSGTTLTNISQLLDAGITNFVIRRGVRPVATENQAGSPAAPQP